MMYEDKVVYGEDETGEFCFGTSVKSKFQQEINEFYKEGWAVKFSKLAAVPSSHAERRRITTYALLEREKIPAPFRESSKKIEHSPLLGSEVNLATNPVLTVEAYQNLH